MSLMGSIKYTYFLIILLSVILQKGTAVCTVDELDDLYIRCNEYQHQQLFAYAYLLAAKKIKDINNICVFCVYRF